MTTRLLMVTALLMLAVSSPSMAAVNMGLFFGLRDETRSEDRLPAIGLAVDLGPTSWIVRPEVGAQAGFAPIYPGYESELSLGLIHYRDFAKGQFYLGAGIASLASRFGYDEGSSQGNYVHGGVLWSRGEDLSLGIDLRFVKADDLRIDDTSYPIGYTQLAFVMSWGWWRRH